MIQKSFISENKKLYLISTPIGNLKDITYRAIETLNEVDYIFCEDTKKSIILLQHYNINKKLYSYHDFNKEKQESTILELLKTGNNIAIISDAGTPGISDPGYEIIKAAIKENYDVISIPGASAILAALIISGLQIQPFTFIGFLPRKQQALNETLDYYKDHKETLVFYESPLRVKKLIEKLYETYGNRKIVLARELTKKFETITRTTTKELLDLELDERGEYVIILEGYNDTIPNITIVEHVDLFIKEGLDEKEALKKVAKIRKISKSEVYKAYKVIA